MGWMNSDRWQYSNQLDCKMSERRYWGPYCKMQLQAVSLSPASCFLAARKASAGEKKQQESKEGKRKEGNPVLGWFQVAVPLLRSSTHLPGCWHLQVGQRPGANGCLLRSALGQSHSGCRRVEAVKGTPVSLASSFQRWSLCLRRK